MEHSPSAKFVGEFIGTYFLVLTVGCNVLTDSIGAALSIGAILMVMVYAIGPVSGAHLNPAVTLSVLVSTNLRPGSGLNAGIALIYMCIQLLAGFCAGCTYEALLSGSFQFAPVGRYHWAQAMAVEVLYTCALCYVVLNVASVKEFPGKDTLDGGKEMQGNQAFGLSIGFTVTAAALAIGGISGCCLNPAVFVGASAATAIQYGSRAAMQHLGLYICAPLLGSLLAAVLFKVVRPKATND